MIERISVGIVSSQTAFWFSGECEGASFLKMVESYFDKAGRYTNIRADKLNFYKKPENVVKYSITLMRGSC